MTFTLWRGSRLLGELRALPSLSNRHSAHSAHVPGPYRATERLTIVGADKQRKDGAALGFRS